MITLQQEAQPSNPPAGKSRIFAGADGDIFQVLPNGTVGKLASLNADSAASKRGTQAVTNGASSQAVAFATAFASAPGMVQVTLRIPNGGDIISIAVDDSTITAAGFTVILAAAVPNGNYKINWSAIL